MTTQLLGYRRPDGKYGIRNYVAIVACMDNSHCIARRVASAVRTTQAICPGFGRDLMGEDAKQHFRTLVNTATNPNVYGAVVISLEQKSAEDVADAIAKTGRPVEAYATQEVGGSVRATQLGIKTAIQLSTDAGRLNKEPMPWTELVLGVKCGASDGSSGLVSNPVTGLVADRVIDHGGSVIITESMEFLGAEHIMAARAADGVTAQKLLDAVNFCVSYGQELGIDILEANPNPDNIEGGISTIEEKALGAIKKGGSRPVMEVIGYGYGPTKKGLVMMDAASAGVESLTALAAGRVQVIIFSTGKGHPSGHPIAPTIKVSGNPYTVKSQEDNIDVDLSAVISQGMSLDEAANILEQELMDVCLGKPTKADLLGETEMAIGRIGRCL